MEFCNTTLTPHYKLEYFESSMDLCPLESRKGLIEKNSISPLSESNRTVECYHCNERPDYECTECTCQICGHKTIAAKRYRCFTCKKVFHEWCQNISPDAILSLDHWQCMDCKPKKELIPMNNDLAEVKYTRQIIIRSVGPTRKMNNASRERECTIVPANHFGPIPNIPVGTCWEYRLQASEAGVHRPLVAGIHGRENEGAYSIVLSGVYPDDFDNGDEFFYSGSGGKAADPTKRLGPQIRNQTLTKSNKALALCCDCPLNDKVGGSAKNWKKGKPVRVIRNYKLAKFSKYAPTQGNRYDGIYKVVKYFPHKGASGFQVWRYLLKRDDPTPPPWTEEGKEMIAQLGLEMIRVSPTIAIKAERFEETVKMEFAEDAPLKMRLRRVRRKLSDSCETPPAKRRAKITTSSPKPSPKIKEERLSPPPTSEPSITYEEDAFLDIKRSPTREPFTPLSIEKSSEPFTPIPIKKSPERVEEQPEENCLDPYLQIKSMDDRPGVTETTFEETSLTATEAVLSNSCMGTIQNIHTTSTAFTQSISTSSYLDNGYMPPTSLPEHCFFSPFTNMPLPESMPVIKGPPISLRSSDTNDDFGFKPIKLTKPRPTISKPIDPVPETLPLEKSATSVVEKNGSFELTDHLKELIEKDSLNKCWWDMCLEKSLPLGKQSFIDEVHQIFTCPCCHKIMNKPVTLKCENRHSACLECISHRFEIFKVRSCPSCQEHFGPSTKIRVNTELSNILSALFPDNNLNLSY